MPRSLQGSWHNAAAQLPVQQTLLLCCSHLGPITERFQLSHHCCPPHSNASLPAGLLAQRRGATAGAANAAAVLLTLTEQMNLTKEEAILGVVAAVPSLLLRSPGAVQGCCSALTKHFHLGPEALAGVVASAPSLLLRSPAELGLMCARIRGLLGRSKHWRDGLEVLCAKPGALARTLSFDSSRQPHSKHLVAFFSDQQQTPSVLLAALNAHIE
ncbi:hypothetical protein DUNSADRAFT_5625 [Dunaliella salina]|uniref:Encoded protein n=1 Tax=Dunaliella salina TaxID=3046 RepID=A0ABQ7FU67_DUNSA|nr:hypothetical protein DUNSADRAFT_5625 [Dunaliella salina]|eukprot:KAF5825969.1 hypothetical protein DUNSADRAFT_5625 [Dunaliella salina]